MLVVLPVPALLPDHLRSCADAPFMEIESAIVLAAPQER